MENQMKELDDIKDYLDRHKFPFETTRKEYEEDYFYHCFDYNGGYNNGGLRIHAQPNYRCLDNYGYGPDQRMEISGVDLTVWVDTHRNGEDNVEKSRDLSFMIEDLAARARKLCSHEYGRELSQQECREHGIAHFGNCWHVYECPKCKELFSVDSSG